MTKTKKTEWKKGGKDFYSKAPHPFKLTIIQLISCDNLFFFWIKGKQALEVINNAQQSKQLEVSQPQTNILCVEFAVFADTYLFVYSSAVFFFFL